MDSPCPETEIGEAREALAQRGHRISRSGVRRLYRFYLAQADHAAGFISWITYRDPTGEQATDLVLRKQAEEMWQ